MSTMKVTLVKPSRHYSPDVVSAYQDEDDGDWVDCYLAVVTGTFLGFRSTRNLITLVYLIAGKLKIPLPT